MLRVVERTYYQQEEIKTLDSRIREAGVNTYSLARQGAVDYPTYESYNEVREERIKEAKNTVNPTTITGETLRPTSIT